HASDKDCNGLSKGEIKQIMRGGEEPVWVSVIRDAEGKEMTRSDLFKHAHGKRPDDNHDITMSYEPLCTTGEGKAIEIEAARNSAVWPDATIEQLQDKKTLLNRLPPLLTEFKSDIEQLGFVY
ncbi:MAG: hypothetical protein D3910_21185, partial [Candidatus Electrothrix sp. ATG2]|nr:hypothetical protein [Candidatus Electrothrix sp. ATG2]